MLDHTPPPATRDSAPREMAARRRLEAAFANAAGVHGFSEVATPMFERSELFSARSGREIKNSLLTFHCDHEEYALRPEMTAPVCRMAASGALDALPSPHRLFYMAPCFRYCRPHSGGRREFTQAGIEILGDSGTGADAEVVAAAYRFLTSIGARDLGVKVGTAGVFSALLPDELGPDDRATVIGHLDRLAAIRERCAAALAGSDALREEQLRADRRDLATVQAQSGYDGARSIAAKPLSDGHDLARALPSEAAATYRYLWSAEGYMPAETGERLLGVSAIQGAPAEVRREAGALLAGSPGATALGELAAVCELLDHYQVGPVQASLGIGRGLNFYTGPVFEISGGGRKLCGGGRYDGLVELFGGPATPATGCALRLDTLLELGYGPVAGDGPGGITLVPAAGADTERAIRLAEALRDAGVPVGGPGSPAWTVDGDRVRGPGGTVTAAAPTPILGALEQARVPGRQAEETP